VKRGINQEAWLGWGDGKAQWALWLFPGRCLRDNELKHEIHSDSVTALITKEKPHVHRVFLVGWKGG
jgi:hypothetical protein